MIGGFIAVIAAVIVMLICFFSNLDMFSRFGNGFGHWLDLFFANMTTQKWVFFIAFAVFVIGLYFYIKGLVKEKKAGEKAPLIPAAVTKFLRDTKGEFKKIVWPTLPAVVRNTGVTLAVCALLGLVIVAIDLGLGALIELLLSIGG